VGAHFRRGDPTSAGGSPSRQASAWAIVGAVVIAAGAPSGPPAARLRSKQQISIAYNQGIARVTGGWILSGTNYPKPASDVLVRTDEQFHVTRANKGAIPAQWKAQRYVHIGDIDVVGNIVYVPFEQPDYSKGTQVVARYDATTLQFLDAVELPQHENSFVAVDPHTHIAYSMDHFDGNALLRYDVARGWKPLAPLALSATLHQTQGASVADGAIWISTSDDHNDLYRVNLKNGQLTVVGQITDPPGEGEGIDVTALASGYLHAMVIDPDQTKVWIEHFAKPPGGGQSSTTGRTAAVVAGATGLILLLGAAVLLMRRAPRRRSAESSGVLGRSPEAARLQ
jgi:hypothetical protein